MQLSIWLESETQSENETIRRFLATERGVAVDGQVYMYIRESMETMLVL